MGTQVESADGTVWAKRTSKAGVGPCVEFFFPKSQYGAFASVIVWEETAEPGTPGQTLHSWWREQVRGGVHTKDVFEPEADTAEDAAHPGEF